jgi:hypothetical protein
MFNMNISNDMGVELQLQPPTAEESELLTFGNETYLFPVVYPFGTVYFIYELCNA